MYTILYAFLGGTGYHYRHEIVAISLPVFKNLYSILWTTSRVTGRGIWTTSYVTSRGIWTASRLTRRSIVRLGYGIYSFISRRRDGPPGPPDAPVPPGPPDAPEINIDVERDERERREAFFERMVDRLTTSQKRDLLLKINEKFPGISISGNSTNNRNNRE